MRAGEWARFAKYPALTDLRLVRVCDLVEQPWLNGGGVAYEIASERNTAGFTWRMSLAKIDRPCPFSDFAGFDRTLLLIHGGSLRLVSPKWRKLLEKGDQHSFDGGGLVLAEVDTPALVLNIMTRRGLAAHRLERVSDTVAFVFEGAAALVALSPSSFEADERLDPLDTALFPPGSSISHFSGDAVLVRFLPSERADGVMT